MEIAQNIGFILTKIFDFMAIPLTPLPFSLLDVMLWCLLGSVLIYFYRKVMGDD